MLAPCRDKTEYCNLIEQVHYLARWCLPCGNVCCSLSRHTDYIYNFLHYFWEASTCRVNKASTAFAHEVHVAVLISRSLQSTATGIGRNMSFFLKTFFRKMWFNAVPPFNLDIGESILYSNHNSHAYMILSPTSKLKGGTAMNVSQNSRRCMNSQ